MDLEPNVTNAEMAEELESIFGDTPPIRPQIFVRTGDCPKTVYFMSEIIKLRNFVGNLRDGKGKDIVIGNSFRWPWNRLPRKEK